MFFLLFISTLVALAITIPRALYSRVPRTHCAACKYNLAGLPPAGTCPECGALYTETTVIRSHWVWKWGLAPRVFAAMFFPAAAPLIAEAAASLMYVREYHSRWGDAWYQTTHRDMAFPALFCIPFLVNSWLLLGTKARVGDCVVRGVERPRYWAELCLSTGLGLAGAFCFGVTTWLSRVTDIFGGDAAGIASLLEFMATIVGIVAGRLLFLWLAWRRSA